MRKAIAYILAFSILGGSIHLDEFAKIPALVNHYKEHKLLHLSDTIIDFVYIHYVIDQKPESGTDGKSDANLPYKSCHAFQVHYVPFLSEHFITTFELFSYTAFICIYNNAKPIHQAYDIWQPPRSC